MQTLLGIMVLFTLYSILATAMLVLYKEIKNENIKREFQENWIKASCYYLCLTFCFSWLSVVTVDISKNIF